MTTPKNRTGIYSAKHWIVLLFLALMLLPLAQLTLPFSLETPLIGVDPNPPFPEFSKENWASEKYQKEYASVFEQRIGFHPTFVRLYNQVQFSLFKSHVIGGLIVGKNDHLYLSPYVDAYTGKDFRGSQDLRLQAQKLICVQKELKKKNIDLFVALGPGKASFYPEYIPPEFLTGANADSTNYSCYRALFRQYQINSLDLREKFSALKTTAPHPLYLNTGVHWTQYGAYVAGKELVSYIEKVRSTDLPDIILDSIKMMSLSGSKSLDYDAANLMNVYTTIPHPPVAVPSLSFGPGKKELNFLCISDSYFPGIEQTGIPRGVFKNYHYWLYFDRIFPESFLAERKVAWYNFKKQVEQNDVICILCTDASLSLFPFGFVDKAYEEYAPKDEEYKRIKASEFRLSVANTIRNIFGNDEWKASLIEQAKKNGLRPADQFISAATWIYDEEQRRLKQNAD